MQHVDIVLRVLDWAQHYIVNSMGWLDDEDASTLASKCHINDDKRKSFVFCSFISYHPWDFSLHTPPLPPHFTRNPMPFAVLLRVLIFHRKKTSLSDGNVTLCQLKFTFIWQQFQELSLFIHIVGWLTHNSQWIFTDFPRFYNFSQVSFVNENCGFTCNTCWLGRV